MYASYTSYINIKYQPYNDTSHIFLCKYFYIFSRKEHFTFQRALDFI